MFRLSALLILFFSVSLLMAQGKSYKFVGVKKCKMCHNSKKKGQQYKIWLDSPHARAFKELSGKKALEFAKANNIADPSKEKRCLGCHSTAAAADPALLTKTITVEEGVSCESCHGPGSAYKSMKKMKDRALAMKNGLILPDEAVCKKCHNPDNPFHKEFKFKQRVAKIAHPIPK